jgi:hypothetical protein
VQIGREGGAERELARISVKERGKKKDVVPNTRCDINKRSEEHKIREWIGGGQRTHLDARDGLNHSGLAVGDVTDGADVDGRLA